MCAPVVCFKKESKIIDVVFDGKNVKAGDAECYFEGCGVIYGIFVRSVEDLVAISD